VSLLSKITKKIAGVEKSRDASDNSEVRELLVQYSEHEEHQGDLEQADRYFKCSVCPLLKEEFKLFGKTVKDMTPACGECGCNLLVKIPMKGMECPIGKW
jgi:hypothetical protein